jgi:hypothetical protein
MASTAPGTKPLPIIHINAFAGTGKLTIANCLIQKLQSTSTPAKLVHNHLLINPVDAILHRSQPGYQEARKAIRSTVFDILEKNEETRGTAYVFTDFQSDNELGSAACKEYEDMARKRGCSFVPVVLRCEEEENLRRVVSSERAGRGKIVDVELMKMFLGGGMVIHRFEELEWFLDIDVTHLSADEAAERIKTHLEKVL